MKEQVDASVRFGPSFRGNEQAAVCLGLTEILLVFVLNILLGMMEAVVHLNHRWIGCWKG